MLIDLFLVALLTRTGGTVLGFSAAFVLWRFSARRSTDGFVKHSVRTALRLAAAVVVFALVAGFARKLFDNDNDPDEDGDPSAESAAGFETAGLELGGDDAMALTPSCSRCQRCDSGAGQKAVGRR